MKLAKYLTYYSRIGDFDRVNEDEIKQIEARCETELPDDYRLFLQRYGACYVMSGGDLRFDRSDGRQFWVTNFSGKDIGIWEHGILNPNLRIYGDRPVTGLPIAGETMGGLYFLGLAPDLENQIIYMHPDDEGQDVVCEGFTTFVNALKFIPNDYSSVE